MSLNLPYNGLISNPKSAFAIENNGNGPAIEAISQNNDALMGLSNGSNKAGVIGKNTSLGGNGVFGSADSGIGVQGISNSGNGIAGMSNNGSAIVGRQQ